MQLNFDSKESIKAKKKVRSSSARQEKLRTIKQQYEDLKEAMETPDGRTKEECVRAFQYWLDSGKSFDDDHFTEDEKEIIIRQLDMPF